MNDKQRKVLIVVAVLILGMMIYPPIVAPRPPNFFVYDYSLIFDLPLLYTVNPVTLLLQWLGVSIVGALAFLICKD